VTTRRPDTTPRLGAWALPDFTLAVLLAAVPIATLVVFSLGASNVVTLDVDITGSLDSYRRLFSDAYRPVIARSYVLSGLAVALCLAVGVPAALAISRMDPRRQRGVMAALLLPSFVSFTVRIFAWQGLLATGGPIESVTGQAWLYKPPAVAIGMATAYLPLFLVPAVAALSRIPASAYDAAADLGAGRWTTTRQVALPLAAPGLVTGAAMVAVLGVGEFVIPTVLGGGKVLLLGGVLSQRGAGSDRPLGGAIVVLMLTTFVFAAVLVMVVRRRAARRGY
jgi:ABC-type spermidine/putrescine transport system permease subunit I